MQGNIVLSEELLLVEVKGIDPETTLAELIAIVDEHCVEHEQKGTHAQWENLADVAFLAFVHQKPRAFRKAVEVILTIFAGFGAFPYSTEMGWAHMARAAALIASDAPTNPAVVAYMLGHLKGGLCAAREFCERLDAPDREMIEARAQNIMQRFLPEPARRPVPVV